MGEVGATVIVGLGRAGAELHLPVVRRIRPGAPIIGVDPLASAIPVTRTASLAEAAERTDPATAVVHLCTPPTNRVAVLEAAAAAGFRRFLVEKPLAVDESDLASILDLAARHQLDLLVVGQWLCSTLTRRLRDLTAIGTLGPLREILLRQRKPRFARSLARAGHPTAFDVEVPHGLGVALALAGPAEVTDAGCADLSVPETTLPHLGSAWLTLAHGTAVTRIDSDLTAPVRERRIELRFEGGTAVGHFPCSDADHYAHLDLVTATGTERLVFPDDSLTAFLARAYAHFDGRQPWPENLPLHADEVRLLGDAKRRCGIALAGVVAR